MQTAKHSYVSVNLTKIMLRPVLYFKTYYIKKLFLYSAGITFEVVTEVCIEKIKLC